MSQRQERILGLIEGYPALFGGVDDEGTRQAHMVRLSRVLHSRPGHWFLVGQRVRFGGQNIGVGSVPRVLRSNGFEAAFMNGNVYARVPHPDGRPLDELVAKRKQWSLGDKLPELTADKFGWSRNELNEAMATARAWLFPIEGIAAA